MPAVICAFVGTVARDGRPLAVLVLVLVVLGGRGGRSFVVVVGSGVGLGSFFVVGGVEFFGPAGLGLGLRLGSSFVAFGLGLGLGSSVVAFVLLDGAGFVGFGVEEGGAGVVIESSVVVGSSIVGGVLGGVGVGSKAIPSLAESALSHRLESRQR